MPGNRFYVTNTGTATTGTYTNAWVADELAVDGWTPRTECKFITQGELDRVLKKIYDIIVDHTQIDISEQEFMRLIKDDD